MGQQTSNKTMMKKITMLLLLVMATATSLQARRVIWDVRAGIGMSQLLCHNKNLGSISAYKASFGMTVPLSNSCRFYFPLEYTRKGGKVKAMDLPLCEFSSAQFGMQFGYLVGIGPIDLNMRVGSYAATYFDKKIWDNNILSLDDGEIGLTGGIDVEYRHYVLSVEYQHGLMRATSSFKSYLYSSALYVTLGYRF